MRQVSHKRYTKETQIDIILNLDGSGKAKLATGIPFFEHMLMQIIHHGRLDLALTAQGDLEIDQHHTIEDIGITLGQAFNQAIGNKQGIKRYGYSYVCLDEALSRAVIDISGRPGLHFYVDYSKTTVGEFDLQLVSEFFYAFVNHAMITLHMDNLRGVNAHHQVESLFKAFACALRQAIAFDDKMQGQTPSTKGTLHC